MENLELTGKAVFNPVDDDFDEDKYHFDLNKLSKKERCIYYAGRTMATVELILELYVHKVLIETITECCYK